MVGHNTYCWQKFCFLTIMMVLYLPRSLCVIYITCSKMREGVLTSLWLGLENISLHIQCYILTLDCLYLIVTIYDGLLMFLLCFLYTLFSKPFYQRNFLGFLRSYNHLYRTIQIDKYIMRIFCSSKGTG